MKRTCYFPALVHLGPEEPVWRIGPPFAWAYSRLEVMSLAHQEGRDTRTHGSSVRGLSICVFSGSASPWWEGPTGPRGRAACVPASMNDDWRLFPTISKNAHYLWAKCTENCIRLWSRTWCVRSSAWKHSLIPWEISALWTHTHTHDPNITNLKKKRVNVLYAVNN